MRASRNTRPSDRSRAGRLRTALSAMAALALGLLVPVTALAQAPPALSPEPAAPVAPATPPPSGGGGGGGGGGNFLVTPSVGLMLWTLLAFGITLLVLRKFAFPRIADALDKRRLAIDESIDASERARDEAQELLEQYRRRLKKARGQSEEILTRARKNAEQTEEQSRQNAQQERDEIMERTKREIQQETERSIGRIRKEVGELTILATERVTRKSLDDDDHRRLVDETLAELDFSALAGGQRRNGEEH